MFNRRTFISSSAVAAGAVILANTAQAEVARANPSGVGGYPDRVLVVRISADKPGSVSPQAQLKVPI